MPSTVAVAPDLSGATDVVTMAAASPVKIEGANRSVEAWFSYPLPFDDADRPYPISVLTSACESGSFGADAWGSAAGSGAPASCCRDMMKAAAATHMFAPTAIQIVLLYPSRGTSTAPEYH